MFDATPKEYIPVTSVQSRTELFKRLQKQTPEQPTLPTQIPKMIQSRADVEALFNLANQAWEEIFNPEVILTALDLITSCPPAVNETFKGDPLKTLIKVRKFGLIVNSAWNLFDANHTASKKHHHLMRHLGRVKDFAYTADLPQHTSNLKSALEVYNPKEMLFEACSPDSFDRNLQHIISKMESILGSDKIREPQYFHELRKNGSRQIMNLFQLAALNTPRPEFEAMYHILHHADHTLGIQYHDVEYRSDVVPLSLQIDQETSQVLFKTLRHLKNQWYPQFQTTFLMTPTHLQ